MKAYATQPLGVIMSSAEGSRASSNSTLPLDNRSSQPPPRETVRPEGGDDSSSSEEEDNEFERRANSFREREYMGGGSGFQLPKLPNTPSTVAGTLGGSTSYVVGGSLSTLSFDGSSGAFKDPTAPTLPRDDRPFWKIQEERRRKQVRKKMMVGVTDVDINKASIMGTLVGERRARPPDMKKMLHEHMTPRDKDGKKIKVLDSHRMVAENIIKTADQGTVDNSVSLNELQIFLKGTYYTGFMEWLTGLTDGDSSRFHSLDDDGSHSIEIEELSVAIADYYSGVLEGKGWEDVVKFAEESKARMERKRMVKRQTIAKEKLITIKKAEAKKVRAAKRKLLAAERLVGSDHDKLEKIRHRLLAASYTSTTWGMNFDLMFERFDRDQNGELDLEELHALVRKVLHVPPMVISNVELGALFSFLDNDGGGAIDQEELVAFLKKGEEEMTGVNLLPSHLKYMGPKRTEHEELCALINFKTMEEKEKEKKEPQPPPGEIPWNTSVRNPRLEKPLASMGHTGYIPMSER